MNAQCDFAVENAKSKEPPNALSEIHQRCKRRSSLTQCSSEECLRLVIDDPSHRMLQELMAVFDVEFVANLFAMRIHRMRTDV